MGGATVIAETADIASGCGFPAAMVPPPTRSGGLPLLGTAWLEKAKGEILQDLPSFHTVDPGTDPGG